jgi:hypothetical protein
MAKLAEVHVKSLYLDLCNYRTTKQRTEKDAIKAMITIKSERFWGVLDSIIESGYLKTENIIVQRDSQNHLIVKEGNRRIAALKLILGLLDIDEFDVPKQYKTKLPNFPVLGKKTIQVLLPMFLINQRLKQSKIL